MNLEKNCYHVHRPRKKSCTNDKAMAVKTNFGRTLSEPLPQQELSRKQIASSIIAHEDDALSVQTQIICIALLCAWKVKENENDLQMLEQTTKFDD